MSGEDDVMRALGRIEGRLEGIQANQVAQGAQMDGISDRLRNVEQRAAGKGGLAGTVSAVGVTLIVEGLKNFSRGG
jgi:hypothetical protein